MRKSQHIRTYAFLLHDLPIRFSLIFPFLTRFHKNACGNSATGFTQKRHTLQYYYSRSESEFQTIFLQFTSCHIKILSTSSYHRKEKSVNHNYSISPQCPSSQSTAPSCNKMNVPFPHHIFIVVYVSQNHIIMKKSHRSSSLATPAGPPLYHLPANLLHDRPELRDRLIILFRINTPQRMGLPRNLVEVIAATIELPHHRVEVRWRQFSGLNPVDELPQIDPTAQSAFLDGGIEAV